MLFNSFNFLFIFLPVALAVYYWLGSLAMPRMATAWLVIASLGFYAYWNWHYALLLMGSVLFNYSAGCYLKAHRSRVLLAAAIGIDLALLGYFKYLGFFVQCARDLGVHCQPFSIILPIGLSFYTFLQIAFLCDAHAGRANDLDFLRYSLFVTFFPHSLAGPLVHHSNLMPQFRLPGAVRWQWDNIHAGLVRLSIGLAKKVLIADTCAPWANALFNAASRPTCMEAWMGALAYTMQIYFDFSGYCDMAVGLGMMFNVKFPENFDSPYRAVSIVDFWRRWHMTLSRWLRDYLYIPLGGNRYGESRRFLNLFLTMLLGGIWHGAGWTFVAWGSYHGLLLVACHLYERTRLRLPLFVSRLLTFTAVVMGWVFFRAQDMSRANMILQAMNPFYNESSAPQHSLAQHLQSLSLLPGGLYEAFVLGSLLALVNVAPNSSEWSESRVMQPRHAVALGVVFFWCLLVMRDVANNLTQSEFIYFKF